MKILQLGKFYPFKGGVEKVMGDLTVGLGKRGVHSDMLCACLFPQEPGVVSYDGNARIICVHALFKSAATMISPAMIFYLRKHHDYDLIHIHHPDPMAALALCLSGYKGKVVLHWHSDICKQRFFLRFYKPLQRWLLKRASVIIGTSPVYLKESPFLSDFQEKTVPVPIGILPVMAHSGEIAKVREMFGGRKIVFSLGRFVEYKGFEYLIEAAAILPEDYVLVIGGDGPLRGEMIQRAHRMGLDGKVFFPGRIPDMDLPSWIHACDVFTLSSVMKTEAFAVVQVEAMSCGKPIVATKIPGSGVSWVNADGVSGLNVPVRDSAALAKAVSDICENEERYSEFSANAQKRYKEMFTRDRMIDTCMNVYKSVLGWE